MFEIYKKGQGGIARWTAAVALGALAAFGCYELRDWAKRHTDAVLLGVDAGVYVAAAGFALAAGAIGWLVNLPRFVDYLIASETELRKVSWPTKPELKRQTQVVIFVMLFFALMLWIADLAFAYGSRLVFGIGS